MHLQYELQSLNEGLDFRQAIYSMSITFHKSSYLRLQI